LKSLLFLPLAAIFLRFFLHVVVNFCPLDVAAKWDSNGRSGRLNITHVPQATVPVGS